MDDKKFILDIHNQIRRDAANGIESRGYVDSLPKAGDMRKMVRDDNCLILSQLV